MDDENFPLPYVNKDKDSLGYVAALGNLNDTDVFTCLLASANLLAVVAFNKQGLPRVLYLVDASDENQNVMDANFPQYVLTPGFALSTPKHNFANDNKYSVFIGCGPQGHFLVNLGESGLEIVTKFYDSDNEEANHFLNFPDSNYDWHFQTEARVSTFPDRFLQPLYNMGADKETLLHWQTNDGHHAFIAIHKDKTGQYVAYPRALMHANQAVHPAASWVMRPRDQINSFVSSNRADQADKIVLWNAAQGCAILSLEQTNNHTYNIHQLKHIPIGGKFHEDCEFTFESGDDFYYANHSLSQNRRAFHAKLFSATRTAHHASHLCADETYDEPRYRMHVRSRTFEKTFSLDFVETDEAAARSGLLSASPMKKSLRFTEMSASLPMPRGEKADWISAPQNTQALENPWAITPSTPQDTANSFLDLYLKHCGFNQYHKEFYPGAHLNTINTKKLNEALQQACNYLETQPQVTEQWISQFRSAVDDRVDTFNIQGNIYQGVVYYCSIIGAGSLPIWGMSHVLCDEEIRKRAKENMWGQLFTNNDSFQKKMDTLIEEMFPKQIQKLEKKIQSRNEEIKNFKPVPERNDAINKLFFSELEKSLKSLELQLKIHTQACKRLQNQDTNLKLLTSQEQATVSDLLHRAQDCEVAFGAIANRMLPRDTESDSTVPDEFDEEILNCAKTPKGYFEDYSIFLATHNNEARGALVLLAGALSVAAVAGAVCVLNKFLPDSNL